jgi:hypothetical protein
MDVMQIVGRTAAIGAVVALAVTVGGCTDDDSSEDTDAGRPVPSTIAEAPKTANTIGSDKPSPTVPPDSTGGAAGNAGVIDDKVAAALKKSLPADSAMPLAVGASYGDMAVPVDEAATIAAAAGSESAQLSELINQHLEGAWIRGAAGPDGLVREVRLGRFDTEENAQKAFVLIAGPFVGEDARGVAAPNGLDGARAFTYVTSAGGRANTPAVGIQMVDGKTVVEVSVIGEGATTDQAGELARAQREAGG